MSRLLHLHGVEDQLIKQQLLCRHDREHEDDVREAARYEEDRTRQESRDVEDAKWKDEFAAMERESGVSLYLNNNKKVQCSPQRLNTDK